MVDNQVVKPALSSLANRECTSCGEVGTVYIAHGPDGFLCIQCDIARIDKAVSLYDHRDTWSDVPICPHCGNDEDNWHEFHWQNFVDGEDASYTCQVCERDVLVTLHAVYSFTTQTDTK